MKRRDFIKTTTLAGAGVITAANEILTAPLILTGKGVRKKTLSGELIFNPYFVQKGRGPHLYDLVWATDENWDTFYSNISKTEKGIAISDSMGAEKFGINCRWNVEGFGYTNITADNGGEFYTLPDDGKVQNLNLNYELAKSRVVRNRNRLEVLKKDGWNSSKEIMMFVNLSESLLEDAGKCGNAVKCAELSQDALKYALWGGEKMELEKAEFLIKRRGYRPEFYFGCDARGFYQMYQDVFIPKFTKLFNYANITFVNKGDGIISDFEPAEGNLQFDIRDVLFNRMLKENVKPEGRLLFWFHDCCIHDWLRNKNYDQLRKYAENHARKLASHYGNDMYAWEIVNELHDWANELNLSNEQTIELTRLICDTIKDAAPKVKRTINNCCPFAEYVQLKTYSSGNPAKYRQRTPWQFTKDIIDAGVDIDIIEQQMYFPYRDLQDTILLIEKFEAFKKPLQLSEVGVSGGPTNESVKLGKVNFPDEPYLWHQPWDEESQADWLQGIYTLAYSKESIKACNWFDFVDPYSYMQNGGLLRNPQGDTKEAYDRLLNLQNKWKSQN